MSKPYSARNTDTDNITINSNITDNILIYNNDRVNNKTEQIKLRRNLLQSGFQINNNNLDEDEIQVENDMQAPEQPNIPLINFQEAYNYFLQNTPNITSKPINRSSGGDGCCSCLSGKLPDNLNADKNILLNIRRIKYNMNNQIHFRILFTIYYFFTKKNCSKIGEHWQDIGLQSDDVETDLVTVGMLAPLQILYAIDEYPKFLFNLYQYLSVRQCELYFGVDLISFTKFILNMIETGDLDYNFNEYKNVTNIANEIFVGMAHHFSYEIQQYGNQNTLTIEFIVKTVQKISELKNQPSFFIKNHNKEV
jgi:hypothetical protein